MKRFVGILLAIISLFSVSAFALEVDAGVSEVMPCYEYVRKATASLDISGGTADASAKVMGYPGTTTRIYITMYLQRNEDGAWKTVKSWSGSSSSYSFELNKSAGVESGYTYRVRASCQVYAGTDCEYVTAYSAEV